MILTLVTGGGVAYELVDAGRPRSADPLRASMDAARLPLASALSAFTKNTGR
jgi:hypothetical protein